jgi:hypothetical protein
MVQKLKNLFSAISAPLRGMGSIYESLTNCLLKLPYGKYILSVLRYFVLAGTKIEKGSPV